MSDKTPEEPKKNRNLLLLGIGAIAIALTTTSVSIAVYHNSGDIYLDRSRPGFLPDKDEADDGPLEDYAFSEDDQVTDDSLKEYLEHYQAALDALDKIEAPFSADALSNESLGIPEDK